MRLRDLTEGARVVIGETHYKGRAGTLVSVDTYRKYTGLGVLLSTVTTSTGTYRLPRMNIVTRSPDPKGHYVLVHLDDLDDDVVEPVRYRLLITPEEHAAAEQAERERRERAAALQDQRAIERTAVRQQADDEIRAHLSPHEYEALMPRTLRYPALSGQITLPELAALVRAAANQT